MSKHPTLSNLRARIVEKHQSAPKPQTCSKAAATAATLMTNPRPEAKTVAPQFVKPIIGNWIHKPGDKYIVEGIDPMGNPLHFETTNPLLAKRTIIASGKKWASRQLEGINEVVERV